MSSISGILSVARSALLAHQAAMEVTGHNIANAETPGYTRQSLLIGQGDPRRMPYGNFGTGVRVNTVGRAREALLDQDVRNQLAPSAQARTRRDTLQRIERVFGEPSPSGLAAGMDAFWNAWSDLAAQPNNQGARTVVRQRAEALVERFHTYSRELQSVETNIRAQARGVLADVNRLTDEIARVNGQVISAESGGHSANDLRDERDRLLDQLGALVPVTVIDRTDGSTQVMLGGRPLVDGTSATTLELTVTLPLEVRIAGEPSALRTKGGELGALVELVNEDLVNVRTALDDMARALVTDVNAVHRTGWSSTAGGAGNWDPLAGPTGSGVNFFSEDPASMRAGGLRLSDEVRDDVGAIAVGATLNATGDNTIALAMAGLRESTPSALGGSLSGAFQSLIADLAGATRAAVDASEVRTTLTQQAEARRQSTSGVSTDEELMRLMRHQQAYAAAAKVVQTVDEMMDALIGLKR
jgi:flagellar hook-associated protein 1